MYHYLPHLIGKPNALKPAIKYSKGRLGASIVMGIPTIKRDVDSYLTKTLISLVESLTTEERADCLIVVFCGEPWDIPYCQSIATLISTKMSEHVNSGLIEIISPPAEFYPNLDNLPATFGDTVERVKWRTKQNLDYSFLMMYAKRRGTYYVQLEDDIVTKTGYFSTMKNFALNQKSNEWMLLEFSSLGFIGKLFKSKDLPIVVEFFLMFYRDKPIDWLLDHLLSVKVCNPEKDSKHCQRSVSELRRRFKPSLFQHVGTHSSLKGKVQKLKDRDFGKGVVRNSHFNPNADVSTTLKNHQRFTLDKAYQGENFFWGILPKKDDLVIFEFNPPVSVEKYLFRSGNTEHPGDKFYNTTVEVLPNDHVEKLDGPLDNKERQNAFPRTDDGFLILNHFSHETGLAEGTIGSALGEIHTLRLRVEAPSDTWVILSEIYIKATPR
ncbi:hypothetical protein CAPTEDRAFT_170426 [Capitella teleta]|uniref:Alpha-1,3-mannosyl-glycoprotein 4-beta-N-acetylglucosaminyltransferase B n=1 Tax=Capitella teleta TaxID=283909 RepID=R7V8T0_CAPTE|nr:hypothetical protein CAPTEDRAFT_170426 [Capitella teleta]|eukprot:ELU12756.1 hypothetical protein CAPTEDRAFT_170426 [Capitella teleta]